MGELGYRPLRRRLTTGNPRPPEAGGARPGGSGRACALGRPRRRRPARETYHLAVGPPFPAAPAAHALARSNTARPYCVAGWRLEPSGLETKRLERGTHAGPPEWLGGPSRPSPGCRS